MPTPSPLIEPAGGPAGALPRSVEEAERAAERIASLARAAAALILAVGLTVALIIVPEPERRSVQPRVLIAIGMMSGFIVLAGISLLASRSRRFRPELAYLFVVGDCLLILLALREGMALSDHPGPLVFAQPPAWLIPIAIAIQAVRFRTGPLAFAAALFIAGLAGLILLTGPAGHEIAPDMKVLFSVPSDAIRGLMLAIAATVLVVSVRSKRDILVRGLDAARRETELMRFLPAEVSRRLASAAGADALAAQRTLAILFIDLSGFTQASERVEPVTVAGWLAAFRDRVDALVRANRGFVDKFIGDGVMAIFGYDEAPEPAARAALRVVEGLPALMGAWRAADPSAPAFEVAVGGALGPVFVGVVGTGERREFTVVGDAVNVAARLEGFAKEQGAMAALGRPLVEAAGAQAGLAAETRSATIRGHREPVEVSLIARG